MLTFFLAGCGSSTENAIAQVIADPTSQLPAHMAWNSYNVYRYQPGSPGQWVEIISLGTVLNGLPDLGTNPVMLTHGLGGSIKNNKLVPLAQNLIDNNLASIVLGFEYDTQASIAQNGTLYAQALQLLTTNSGVGLNWSFISHSMGGLVTRSAVQNNTLPIAIGGNRVITLGTPHFGSPVANAVQDTADVAVKAVVIADLDQGGYNNADGNPCRVDLASQGLTDLRTGSDFLAALNANITNHPQVDYFTVAGTNPGEYGDMDSLLGVTTDDGLVTLASANPIELGASGSGTAPVDHTQLITDTVTTFPLVRAFLVQ